MTHEAPKIVQDAVQAPLEQPFLEFRPGLHDITQSEMQAMVPGFFTQSEGVVGAVPKTEEQIQTLTMEDAKADLDQLPIIRLNVPNGEHATFRSSEGFQIPVDRVIAATGFGIDQEPTWAGRAGGYESSNGERSINKVIRYAQKGKYDPTTSLEDRIALQAYFTPEGEAFFMAVTGNHRVAAAKLRGDHTVTTQDIQVSRDVAILPQWQVDKIYGVNSVATEEQTRKVEIPPEPTPVEAFMQAAENFEPGQEMRVGGRVLKFRDNVMARRPDGRVAVLEFEQGEGEGILTITVEDFLREQAEFREGHKEGLEELGKTALDTELEPSSRNAILFAPVESDAAPEQEADLSHLLNPDSTVGVEDGVIRPAKGRHTTEQSIREAVLCLQDVKTQNPKLMEIISGDAGDIKSLTEMTAELRRNPALRLKIGEYLLEEIDASAAELGNQVSRNPDKTPSYPGYKFEGIRLKSREYVALLALSMLDGTFDPESSKSNAINQTAGVSNGQHRIAAQKILTNSADQTEAQKVAQQIESSAVR